MSDSRHEESRASEQNAGGGFLSLPSAPQLVARHSEDIGDALLCLERLPAHQTQDRKGNGNDYADAVSSDHSDVQHPSSRDPRTNRSHRDRRDAVSSVCRGQRQERRMRSASCHRHRMHKIHRMHRMRGQRSQLGADQRELGGQREWEARCEERDQRAFFPGFELKNGEVAAGSGHAQSNGAGVLSEGAGLAPSSSARSVPARSQDVEDGPRRPELAADCQMCHRRPCCWAAWEERERGPGCSSCPHLGTCEWGWERPGSTSPCQLATDYQMCHRSPCNCAVRVKLELWPSCSWYPHFGPCEWSWRRPSYTCRCLEYCPTCRRAHRF